MCPINFCKHGACIDTTHPDFLNKTILNEDLRTLDFLKTSEMMELYDANEAVFEGLKEDAMICKCPKGYAGKICAGKISCEFRFVFLAKRVVILNYFYISFFMEVV